MSEQNATATTDKTQPPVKIASAGGPERGEIPPMFAAKLAEADGAQPNQGDANSNQQIENTTAQQPATGTTETTKPPTQNGDVTNQPAQQSPDISDEDLKRILAGKGISFEGDFEAMKAKLSAPEYKPEPTAEEKQKQETAIERRMLDRYLTDGGTIEQFTALKHVAAMDLKLLSIAQIRNELKENGFSDTDADFVIKERYYQLNPDELERGVDESEEDFSRRKELIKKKVSYGSKVLENRASHTKEEAAIQLKALREAVQQEDLQRERENKISSTVDEISKTFPRKITLELGELNNSKLDPVTYDVSESDIAEVSALLKDPDKRKQFLFNEDGTYNLSNLMDAMLAKKYLSSAVKAGVIEGSNRQVAIFKQRFPDSANAVGVGGPAVGQGSRKGAPASYGRPEVAAPLNKK